MRRIYWVGLVAMVGCASAKRVNGPDGTGEWYAIECTRNQSNCLEKAGEVCPDGYITASEQGREGVYAQANASGAMVTPTYNGEMLIKCRANKGTEAKATPPSDCKVDGTYTVIGTKEAGDCPDSDKAVTDTFTTLSDGRVRLDIMGLPELTPIGTMNGCTWTATSALPVSATSKATVQYSYTFTKDGINGTAALVYPPVSDLPQGCRGVSKITGTRR